MLVEKDLKKRYVWVDIPIPTESIVYKMDADSSGNLYVPVGARSASSSYGISYDWNVCVDWGDFVNYSGTSSSQGRIILPGYTEGTSHTIMIQPTTEDYGWARAYAWELVNGRTNVTEVVYDGSIKGFCISSTDTGNYFRYRTYYGCTALATIPEEEVLPSTITTIGDYFRGEEYSRTNISFAPVEVLPDSVTSIGVYFREQQYQNCSSLTEIKGWKDLSIGNSYYRDGQFSNGISNGIVTVLSDVGYGAASGAISNSSISVVYVPSAYLSNFVNTNKQPRTNITDSKFVGY